MNILLDSNLFLAKYILFHTYKFALIVFNTAYDMFRKLILILNQREIRGKYILETLKCQ